jgi:hypothetical protein
MIRAYGLALIGNAANQTKDKAFADAIAKANALMVEAAENGDGTAETLLALVEAGVIKLGDAPTVSKSGGAATLVGCTLVGGIQVGDDRHLVVMSRDQPMAEKFCRMAIAMDITSLMTEHHREIV